MTVGIHTSALLATRVAGVRVFGFAYRFTPGATG